MPDLCFDPYVLSCPDPAGDPAVLELYVRRLLAWRDFVVREDSISLLTSHSACAVLFATGSYPDKPLLDRVIGRLPERYFSSRDIDALVRRLLHLCPVLEDVLGVDDILIENVALEPCSHLALRPAPFVYPYELLLALLCLLDSKQPGTKVLVTCDLESGTEIQVSADIPVCEVSSNFPGSDPPSAVQGRCLTCSTPESLSLSVDPLRLWLEARGDSEYHYALDTHVIQVAASLGRPISERRLASWRFGPSFLETARSEGFTNDRAKVGKLLKACAQTIVMPEAGRAEHIREGRGPEEAQKRRPKDGALAWRRHIDRYFRLNYWENGPTIEFAGVDPKRANERDIDIPK